MNQDVSEADFDADAATIESLVLAPAALIVLTLNTELEYFLTYVGGVLLLMVFTALRYMSGKVEDPNRGAVLKSLKVSSKVMQLVFVGAIASICIHIQSFSTVFTPLTIFIILATAAQFSTVYVGEMWLRNYLDFWREVVQQETEDNLFGRKLESVVVSRISLLQAFLHKSSIPEPEDRLEGIGFAIFVFIFFLIIGLPIWGVLASLSAPPGIAIMSLLSILFLRDITRYLYVEFGAANRFAQLTLGTKWEILWTMLVAILLAGTLGYDLSPLFPPG